MEEVTVTICTPAAPAADRDEQEPGAVRRHRLAEVLFLSVIHVSDEAPVRRAACAFEQALDPAATEAVCTFLGHPRSCPHGKPIEPGECCHASSRPSQPLVEPLARLAPGCDADVVYLVAPDPRRIARLAALGVAPGARLHLMQTAPAVVVRVAETTLAFESTLAEDIYVRRPAWP
jgi:DtxR family transcriptional regulator, Mn-dependent transcriptional regulator